MSYREFKDEHGVEWKVWDVLPQNVEHRAPRTPADGVPAYRKGDQRRHHNDSQEVRLRMRPGWESGWLSFESDAEKRRLIPLPNDWEQAPIEQIRAWLAAAAPFPKRGSFIE